jgi:predicted membrane channel-forming protein YqfA (hemolysin III family)
MLSDFLGLGVLATVIGAFIYTQVPPHWQSLGGFLLIVFGWLPVGILAICLFKAPVMMVPALIVVVALIAPRKTA